MSSFHFPVAVAAPAVRTKESRRIAMLVSVVFFALALTQLVSFPGFIEALFYFHLSYTQSAWLGSILVGSELLAIPFLLRWRLSIGFRVVSMKLGWFASLGWIVLSIEGIIDAVPSVPFFGGVIHLVPALWEPCLSIALVILVAWASWGLWPLWRNHQKHQGKKRIKR